MWDERDPTLSRYSEECGVDLDRSLRSSHCPFDDFVKAETCVLAFVRWVLVDVDYELRCNGQSSAELSCRGKHIVGGRENVHAAVMDWVRLERIRSAAVCVSCRSSSILVEGVVVEIKVATALPSSYVPRIQFKCPSRSTMTSDADLSA